MGSIVAQQAKAQNSLENTIVCFSDRRARNAVIYLPFRGFNYLRIQASLLHRKGECNCMVLGIRNVQEYTSATQARVP